MQIEGVPFGWFHTQCTLGSKAHLSMLMSIYLGRYFEMEIIMYRHSHSVILATPAFKHRHTCDFDCEKLNIWLLSLPYDTICCFHFVCHWFKPPKVIRLLKQPQFFYCNGCISLDNLACAIYIMFPLLGMAPMWPVLLRLIWLWWLTIKGLLILQILMWVS